MISNTGTFFCERLAYYGIATNLVTFLTTKLHQGLVSAAKNVTTFQGTCYLTPSSSSPTINNIMSKHNLLQLTK
jgi:hypothetical protein